MMVIDPSTAEISAGALTQANLDTGVAALKADGFVVLDGAVDPGHLDTIRAQMIDDLERVMARPRVPHNFVWGHVAQDPPPTRDLTFSDVVANPLACQVTAHVLGPGAYMNEVSGNTNLPGSKSQPVHVDEGQLWRDLSVAPPPARLVINVPLTDTSAANGAIELWPGSHNELGAVIGAHLPVPTAEMNRRRASAPPVRVTTKQGALLIRDMRVWHRGVANHSSAPRFMVGMVHNVPWIHRDSDGVLDSSCASAFDGCPIVNAIEMVKDPGDHYLNRKEPYAYDESRSEPCTGD